MDIQCIISLAIVDIVIGIAIANLDSTNAQSVNDIVICTGTGR